MSQDRISWVEVALVLAIVALVVVIARPGLVRGRRAVNEEEAIGALRTLAVVEERYQNRHPSTGFTCSLDELLHEGLIDRALASGARSGYRLSATGCVGAAPRPGPKAAQEPRPAPPATEYQWFADPLNPEAGTRHFCVDQTKVLRASDTYSGQDCLVMGAEL